jgi:hypothetical protein
MIVMLVAFNVGKDPPGNVGMVDAMEKWHGEEVCGTT